MQINMTELLTTLGTSAILIAILAFLARSIINHFLSKDIETYKTSLQAETEKIMVEFKHSLEKTSYEHQIRYKSLHEKRAEVIAETYGLLVDAVSATHSYLYPIPKPNQKDRFFEVMKALKNWQEYFYRNRIYLPEKVCLEIDNIFTHLLNPNLNAMVSLELSDREPTLLEKQAVLKGAWDSVEAKVTPAKKLLEDELRKLLGDQGATANERSH